MNKQTVAVVVIFLAHATARSQTPPTSSAENRDPTVANFAYGTASERQKLDFWKAESHTPTPVVLMIHGGGWIRGDKSGYGESAVRPFLEAGISVAAINYRFIAQAMEQGVEPPVKACVMDAARALQTIRSKAKEWNIDPQRVGSTGGSAGACTSLWLALHDDLAEPSSNDPIARESTRLSCAAVLGAQTSLDPRELREWMPNAEYAGHAFGFAAPRRSRKEEFELLIVNRENVLPWIKEYSPVELVSADDPPIYLEFARQNTPPIVGQRQADPTHSAIYGIKLAEKLQDMGVEAVLSYQDHEETIYGSVNAFLMEKLRPR
jgi:acetyl esterase/lipase